MAALAGVMAGSISRHVPALPLHWRPAQAKAGTSFKTARGSSAHDLYWPASQCRTCTAPSVLNARSLCGFRQGSDEFPKAKCPWGDAEHRSTVAGLGNPSAAISWTEGRHASEVLLHKLRVLHSSQGILPWPLPCRGQTGF